MLHFSYPTMIGALIAGALISSPISYFILKKTIGQGLINDMRSSQIAATSGESPPTGPTP
ncbi:MAG: hypothetical protein ABJN72_05280 [Sulfitobacter sp.]